MHGAPRRVFVGDRRPEQRHEPVAPVLVDAAFEPVNFGGDQPEAALNDVMDLLGIELLAESSVVREITEHDRHLPPLAFQCRALAQDLLGEMTGHVRNKCVGRADAGRARFRG